MWEQAAGRRSLCTGAAHGLVREVFQMNARVGGGGLRKFPEHVQPALYKMSENKYSHSCSVPTQAGSLFGDVIVIYILVTIYMFRKT